MARNVVADFTAFLSVAADDEQVFEDGEGRVVMTRDAIAVAGDGSKRELPLSSVVEFDFRTVPPEWEGFFDDLVGVRFDHGGQEYTVTVGTDTDTADRFVTALLRLRLAETTARVRQKRHRLDGDDESHEVRTAFTLLPDSERIEFDAAGPAAIDVATVTGVSRRGESILVRHLTERGRVATELTPDTDAGSQFLATYLNFRVEVAEAAGPIEFLFAGEDRDTLVLVAKLLKHRNLEFEATHARSETEALDALGGEGGPECVLSAAPLAGAIQSELAEQGRSLPMVLVDRGGEGRPDVSHERVVETVALESRTAHHEDIADAIERAVVASRLER